MKISKTTVAIAVVTGIAAAAYVANVAYRASRDLVTLNVRNMDVRQVVKKVERQTWEEIQVGGGVEGKVTLNVRNAPLRQVLDLIAGQTFARASAIYPLYSSARSLEKLKRGLRGEIDPAANGWTNLQTRGMRGFGPGGPGGPGGPMMMAMGPGGFDQQPAPRRVSLSISSKDLDFAVLAFGRFGRARVVPEDGTSATITLNLKDAEISRAVKQLANKADRKTELVYALESFRPPGGDVAFGRGPRDGQFRPDGDGPRREFSDQDREAMRARQQAIEAELRSTLPAAERQKLEQAEAERQKQMAELQNLTPEQRRERMMQMGAAQMRQQNINRLMNSTPEQRSAQSRQMREMRQRMEQGGQPGGPRRDGAAGPRTAQ